MRVLHVHSGNMYGGVETLLTTLVRHRDRCAEVEPQVALCFGGRLEEQLRQEGVTPIMLGEVRVSRPFSVRRARRALLDRLRREPPDVVLCHSAWSMAVFGPVVKKTGIPLVFWLHDAISGRHWLQRWASRTRPDLALCNSRYIAGLLPRMYPGVRSHMLYYPVAAPEMPACSESRAATRAELDTPPGVCVLIQVGRLERYKGHGLLMEALGRMRDVPGWICWQVGGAQRPAEREYLEELKAEAERLGIADRVRFLGMRRDVPRLLAAADIHCQPNLAPEPFGLVFIEALQAALPVVTVDSGGASEIVTDSCGVLIPDPDPALLAAALTSLVSHPTRRRELGANGPDRARELCDLDAQLANFRDALRTVVSGN